MICSSACCLRVAHTRTTTHTGIKLFLSGDSAVRSGGEGRKRRVSPDNSLTAAECCTAVSHPECVRSGVWIRPRRRPRDGGESVYQLFTSFASRSLVESTITKIQTGSRCNRRRQIRAPQTTTTRLRGGTTAVHARHTALISDNVFSTNSKN